MKKFIVDTDIRHELDIDQLRCCGIYELEGICNLTPAEVVYVVKEELHRPYEMVVFHDVVQRRHGTKLSAFIRRHKLGQVSASKEVYNPNSGNYIRMWTWYPNWNNIKVFVDKRVKIKDYYY